MRDKKIAILLDSGTDVPPSFVKEHNLFVAPLKIIYHDREYNDRVDITPQEIYERLEVEIPRTSLPDSGYINDLLEEITAQGYDTVIAITISTGLSGTHNLLNNLLRDYGKLEYHMLDTKSIGIGAGQQAILAAELLKAGESLESVLKKVQASIDKSKVFFCLDTLEYLSKGGRIGKVTAMLGSLLKLRPVISCNQDGIYDTVAKVRGSAQALAKTISIATAEAGKHIRYAISVAHGSAKAEAERVMAEMKRLLPACERFLSTDVSPALAVHTGPGLIGVSVQALP